MVSPHLWHMIQTWYGGTKGHSIDLMAKESNVQLDMYGNPLPFFAETPMARALRVNIFAQSPVEYDPELFWNPYVFLPIWLIPHVLKYLNGLNLTYTIMKLLNR